MKNVQKIIHYILLVCLLTHPVLPLFADRILDTKHLAPVSIFQNFEEVALSFASNFAKYRSGFRYNSFNNPNIRELENEAVTYIFSEVFSAFQKYSQEEDAKILAPLRQDLRKLLDAWQKHEDLFPDTFKFRLRALEIVLFKNDLAENLVNTLLDMKDRERDFITMMGFAFSMSQLNKEKHGGYDTADVIRDHQVQFISNMMPDANISLESNKIFAISEAAAIALRPLKELDGKSIVEFLNFFGTDSAIKNAEVEKAIEELLKFSKEDLQKLGEQNNYQDQIYKRLISEFEAKKNALDPSTEHEKNLIANYEKAIKYLKKQNELGEKETKSLSFNAFSREFSNLHTKLKAALDQEDHEKFTYLVSEEIEKNFAKILRDIDPVLTSFEISPFNTDEYMFEEWDWAPEKYYAEIKKLIRDMKPQLAKHVDEFKNFESNPTAIPDQDVMRVLPQFFPNGEVMPFDAFRIYLKNLIKRRRYIMDVNNSLKSYYEPYRADARSLWEEMMTTSPEKRNQIFAQKAVYGKAIEIMDRVFDEFEGRSKGKFHFYAEMEGNYRIPSQPYFFSNPDYDRYQPIKMLLDLRNFSDSGKFGEFSSRLSNLMKEAVLNPRNHHFIRSREFFAEVGEQVVNFLETEDPFYKQFQDLWGFGFPIIATIDGDEHRTVFKGPDGQVYHMSFDFENFQAAELAVRTILGRPYRKDELFFDLHEAIPAMINEKIQEFNRDVKTGERRNRDFESFFNGEILNKISDVLPERVWVNINPRETKDIGFLSFLQQYLYHAWEKLLNMKDHYLITDEELNKYTVFYDTILSEIQSSQPTTGEDLKMLSDYVIYEDSESLEEYNDVPLPHWDRFTYIQVINKTYDALFDVATDMKSPEGFVADLHANFTFLPNKNSETFIRDLQEFCHAINNLLSRHKSEFPRTHKGVIEELNQQVQYLISEYNAKAERDANFLSSDYRPNFWSIPLSAFFFKGLRKVETFGAAISRLENGRLEKVAIPVTASISKPEALPSTQDLLKIEDYANELSLNDAAVSSTKEHIPGRKVYLRESGSLFEIFADGIKIPVANDFDEKEALIKERKMMFISQNEEGEEEKSKNTNQGPDIARKVFFRLFKQFIGMNYAEQIWNQKGRQIAEIISLIETPPDPKGQFQLFIKNSISLEKGFELIGDMEISVDGKSLEIRDLINSLVEAQIVAANKGKVFLQPGFFEELVEEYHFQANMTVYDHLRSYNQDVIETAS